MSQTGVEVNRVHDPGHGISLHGVVALGDHKEVWSALGGLDSHVLDPAQQPNNQLLRATIRDFKDLNKSMRHPLLLVESDTRAAGFVTYGFDQEILHMLARIDYPPSSSYLLWREA